MKSKKLLIGLLALLFAVLLSGCGSWADAEENTSPELHEDDQTPPEYLYTPETVAYTEKNDLYSCRMDMARTDTDRAHYFFEKKISEEQRTACIRATEQLLSRLETLPDIPEICVLTEKSYASRFIVGNRIFLTEQDWETPEYAVNVLMAVYGDFTHYGLTYGYAQLLCEQLKWITPTDRSFSIPSAAEVCDLGLLCFDTMFVSNADATAATDLAYLFAAYCGEEELRQLIAGSDTNEGMAAVGITLSRFYAENGLTYQPSTIRYGFGGISYDYIVESDIGTFYLCRDWKDPFRSVYIHTSENFLHENYPIIKTYFETSLAEMQLYRERLALYPYEDDIAIVYRNSTYSGASWYDPAAKRINNTSASSLIHEYIHVLTYSADLQPWEVEGITRYAEVWFNTYGIALENADLKYILNSEDPKFAYIRDYARTLDRPLDHASDYLELFNIWVYTNNVADPNEDGGYRAGASFLGYLISQYSEQTVLQSLYGSGEPLPESHEELVANWVAYLRTTYQGYGAKNPS